MQGWYVLLALVFFGLVVGGVSTWNQVETDGEQATFSDTRMETLQLSSPEFENGGTIPAKFTCDGENVSPAISWGAVPAGTQTLALLMDDPDVPKQLKPDGVFDHWTIFNIPAVVTQVPEGGLRGATGVIGVNGAGKNAYTGPCPPKEYEPSEHRYFFRLYALDTMLAPEAGATKAEVLAAMEGHILGQGELMGRYKRR